MAREHDEFFWITAINKATVVVEGRNGLLMRRFFASRRRA